ncbi:MAG: ABC transporter permease subunit [Gammaproteobacteria bacterium]
MSEAALPRRNLLSRLWNDKEARQVIIQIIAFFLIFAFFFMMVRNAIINLEALGKDLSLKFFWQPASYDISQSLIEYSSRSTHFRATIVGILNTLLVAVFGIALATVIGFLLGIARLSKNWVINKIAYVYIEYVRNVPVLLHILLMHGMIINFLPLPKQSLAVGDGAFLNNRGFFVPKPDFEPLFLGVVALFIGGIVFALWFRNYARAVQDRSGKRYPVFWVCLAAVIGAPLLGYFLLGAPIVWEVPAFKGFNYQGGMVLRPEFIALWLALSIYTASFIGEIVRAGISAVDTGQNEAASALGVTRGRTLQLVVIPQALRIIVPPLTSQYLNLTKNSSLAIAIGYMDIVATIGGITLNQTGREMECMTIVLALYLVFSLLISGFMNWYNQRIKLVER